MSAIFPRFIEAQDVIPRVYFSDDHLVGFSAVQLVDGGQTSWLRAARVKAEFRNRGFYRPIVSSMVREYPGTKHTVCATVDHEMFDIRKLPPIKERGVKELYRKRIINRVFKSESLLVADKDEGQSRVVSLSADGLSRVCENKVICDRFFPERRIFAHSVYLKLIPENFGELLSEQSQIYVTSRLDERDVSDVRSKGSNPAVSGVLSENYIANIDTISAAYVNPADCGLLYEVDVITGSCEKSVTSHMEYHVRQMKRLAGDGGVLMLTFGDDLEEDIVTSCLQKHGLTEPFTAGERYIITNEVCC